MAKLLYAMGAVLVVAGCGPSQVSPQADILAGELMDPGVSYEYAVYYLPTPTTDPLAVTAVLPFHIPELHAGQVVKVRQKDVFDYIRSYADGREEGNETGKILQKMQG